MSDMARARPAAGARAKQAVLRRPSAKATKPKKKPAASVDRATQNEKPAKPAAASLQNAQDSPGTEPAPVLASGAGSCDQVLAQVIGSRSLAAAAAAASAQTALACAQAAGVPSPGPPAALRRLQPLDPADCDDNSLVPRTPEQAQTQDATQTRSPPGRQVVPSRQAQLLAPLFQLDEWDGLTSDEKIRRLEEAAEEHSPYWLREQRTF